MCGQIPDIVRYKGDEYELIGVEELGPFDPETFGLRPEMMHTGCYRGFYCSFGIARGRFRLNRLTVLDARRHYPPIRGTVPRIRRAVFSDTGEEFVGEAEYVGLRMPLDFSGRLRLGRGLIWERVENMGFQSPDAYEVVLDLSFDKGELIDVVDRSEDAAVPISVSPDPVEWIAERFARRM